MNIRLVLRLLFIVALGWGYTRLVQLAPPAWHTPLAAFLPVTISLLLAFMFGRSLFEGEALITRIARCEQPDGLSDVLIHYTRRLTAIWSLYMLGCALLCAVLAPQVSAGLLAALPPVLAGALICAEYLFRKWRFREYTHRNPLALMLFLIQHGFPVR
ncbi:MAG: hypothetical protein K8H84_13850 [Sulfuricella denitrificans]|nr:hypothetical protein [Sulfuricella denitrificans]